MRTCQDLDVANLIEQYWRDAMREGHDDDKFKKELAEHPFLALAKFLVTNQDKYREAEAEIAETIVKYVLKGGTSDYGRILSLHSVPPENAADCFRKGAGSNDETSNESIFDGTSEIQGKNPVYLYPPTCC